MAKICPLKGCEVKQGMCIHDKMMIVALVIVVIVVGYFVTRPRSSPTGSVEAPIGENALLNDAVVTAEDTTAQPVLKDGTYEAYAPEKIATAAAKGNVVLFFRALWCPTCRGLDADLRASLKDIPANLTILIVDYDNSTELKKKYGITVQHTLVQVDKDGALINKWQGSPTLETLISEIK